MTAVNFINCPYCASFVSNIHGMTDLWEEITCKYCDNTFSARIQVSKELYFNLNEIAIKEKNKMVSRIFKEK